MSVYTARMAIQRKPVRLCDRCGSTRGTERWRVLKMEARKQATFDACKDCRDTVPLTEWEKLIPRSPRGNTQGLVVPLDVVEKAKRRR